MPTMDASRAVSQLARDLHRMGPAAVRALRADLERLGAPLLALARSNASWSTRIPAALSVRGTGSDATGRVGLELRASAAQAPHARPYEGLGGGASFRHPVYGHDTWVSQAARPYAAPAVKSYGEPAAQAALAAIEDAARSVGFH